MCKYEQKYKRLFAILVHHTYFIFRNFFVKIKLRIVSKGGFNIVLIHLELAEK